MENNKNIKEIQAKTDKPKSGWTALALIILTIIISIALFFTGIVINSKAGAAVSALGALIFVADMFAFAGLKVVQPNHALVLTLFGKYYRTIEESGFYFVNPFSSAANPMYYAAALEVLLADESTEKSKSSSSSKSSTKSISLKTRTLDNGVQKVNDVLGNPISIGAVVIWRVSDATKAVFNVENYCEFISSQTDSTVRNVARLYPYDVIDEFEENADHTEKTLRGSSLEIAENMKNELAKRVAVAGLEIEEVRINHIAYSEEIAAAMLQRQQAAAIIAARQKIVDGAVSMVKMAIDKLGEEDIVMLDEERKAQMVSNLLVVLCSNKDTQPVVNSGSIY